MDASQDKTAPVTPYAILGDDGIRALANTFYDVMDERIEAAEIRAMHAASMDEIRQKLYEYLCGWMGGPPLYQQKYGTVCLTEPHKPYAIGPAQRDQWLDCMTIAVQRVASRCTDDPERLIAMLDRPFYRVADVVRNRD